MGKYWYLYLPCVIILMCPVLYHLFKIPAEKKKEKLRGYFKTDDKFDRMIDSKSVEKVEDYIQELESAYDEAEPYMTDSVRYIGRSNINDLNDHLKDIEEEKWEKKAGPHLQEFIDCFTTVMDGELNNFKDVELLLKVKNRCIREWQAYYAVDLSDYRNTIYPKRYMREVMESLEIYDPCVESHETLERKLNNAIQTARPEYKRKMKLYRDIIDYVRQEKSVSRGALLKHEFEGFVPEEVRACYRALLRENRLVEIKIGSKVFVSLTDSEAAKRVSAPVIKTVQKKDLPEWDVIDYLQKKGLTYVDKREQGGALWVVGGHELNEFMSELQEQGFRFCYKEQGGKASKGASAWYMTK